MPATATIANITVLMRLSLPDWLSPLQAASGAPRLWIGTQPGGEQGSIHVVDFDSATGEFGRARKVVDIPNPSWLCPGPRPGILHTVVEHGGPSGGRVCTFDVRGRRVRLLGEVRSMGEYPCHLTLAPDGSFLFVANYGGGVSKLPLGADGAVGASGSPIVTPLPRSRAHWVGFRDGTLWVADFGHDCLRLIEQSGREVHTVRFPSGAGPRTIAWHPHLPVCFVACESDNTVRVVSTPTGEARIVGEHSLLPPGVHVRSVAAHVATDASGQFVYASNRGHDSVAVFEVSPTGGLTPCGHASSGGAHPRHFTVDPTGRWLIVANRDSNNVVPIPVHEGRPGQARKPVHVRAPSSVTFVNGE